MQIFGRRERIAFVVDLQEIETHKRKAWGGFEFWIGNIKLGDIEYSELLSGPIYSMIEKFASNNFPENPFNESMEDSEFLNSVFNHYSGVSRSQEISLKESYQNSIFWSRFIILPNNSMPFDDMQMVFYEENRNVVLILREKLEEELNVNRFAIEPNSVKRIADEFIKWHNNLFEVGAISNPSLV